MQGITSNGVKLVGDLEESELETEDIIQPAKYLDLLIYVSWSDTLKPLPIENHDQAITDGSSLLKLFLIALQFHGWLIALWPNNVLFLVQWCIYLS